MFPIHGARNLHFNENFRSDFRPETQRNLQSREFHRFDTEPLDSVPEASLRYRIGDRDEATIPSRERARRAKRGRVALLRERDRGTSTRRRKRERGGEGEKERRRQSNRQMEMAPKFSPLPPTRPDRIKLLGDGRKYRGSTRCSREEKRAWIERGGGRGGTRAVTIALERHDVVHVHTDDRSVCIPGGGGAWKVEKERGWGRRSCVTFYGSTGPVPPLMFSNFTCGRAPGIQGPRDTYVVSCVDCYDCDGWEGG